MSNNKPCDTIGCACEVPEGVKHCDRHLCYALREPAYDGWQMVPIIPTPEMLAAVSVGAVNRDLVSSRAIALWGSMLEAAPNIPGESVVSTSVSGDELQATLDRAIARAAASTSLTPEQAVANYLASIKSNLYPKEKCPHCGGSNAPYDQVDCVDIPCPVGRDFRRPPLEEVIQRIEGLLAINRPVGAESNG